MMIPIDEQLRMIAWLDETKVLGKDLELKLGTKVQAYDSRTGTISEIIEPTDGYGIVTVTWEDGSETPFSYNHVLEVLRVL